MSLILRPPRLTALGLDWCEDFRRGPVGVSKNGGDIQGSGSDIVEFNGEWSKFPGNTAAYIRYPRRSTLGRTAITVGARFRNVTDTGDNQWTLCQAAVAAWPTNVAFVIYLRPAQNLVAIGFNIGGWQFVQKTNMTDEVTPFQVVATWATGDKMRIYINGEFDIEGGVLAGTINDAPQPLVIGKASASNDYPFEGEIADPILDLSRQWSAAEILEYYNGSLFH